MNPMHEISVRYVPRSDIRQRLQSAWTDSVGDLRAPLPIHCIAETPLIMSARLHSELSLCVAHVYRCLKNKLDSGFWKKDPDWPGASGPDVLAIDIAVVHDPESPGGWGVRLVEFQAFHSIAVTVYGLHLAWVTQHRWLSDMAPYVLPEYADDWAAQVRDWCAPAQTILLEHAPLSQRTAFDLMATSQLFQLTPTEPHQLRNINGVLYRISDGSHVKVQHVLNRLILSDDPQHARTRKIIMQTGARWSGHPVWFGRINKALLPEVPVPAHMRSIRADRWRELGVDASDLVLKSVHSWGGTAVHLYVTEQQLTTLKTPKEWIVQPRYRMFPVATARDGAPLFSEIRCLLALSPQRSPWIVSRFARVVRTPLVSLTTWTGLSGEGIAPVYAPPGSRGDLPDVN